MVLVVVVLYRWHCWTQGQPSRTTHGPSPWELRRIFSSRGSSTAAATAAADSHRRIDRVRLPICPGHVLRCRRKSTLPRRRTYGIKQQRAVGGSGDSPIASARTSSVRAEHKRACCLWQGITATGHTEREGIRISAPVLQAESARGCTTSHSHCSGSALKQLDNTVTPSSAAGRRRTTGSSSPPPRWLLAPGSS